MIFPLILFDFEDDWCENALNLTSGKLIVNKDWPSGTYCQWLITSENNNSYITFSTFTSVHPNVCLVTHIVPSHLQVSSCS